MVERPEPVRDLDWDPKRARAFTDGVADIYEELLTRLRDLPVSRGWGVQEVRDAVAIPDPGRADARGRAPRLPRSVTFDYSGYLGHPRFYAYISGAGTVPGAAADLSASGLNGNAGGWRLAPAATEIELGFARWFAQDVFGLPATVRRRAHVRRGDGELHRAEGGARREGGLGHPQGRRRRRTDARHVRLDRDAHRLDPRRRHAGDRVAGTCAQISVGPDYRIRVDELARGDRARPRGRVSSPIAVVANAGTVSTGVVDPLEEIADLCREEDLWFHVDAAYGGPAMLADDLRPLFAGIERADSIAFDPHKWLYTPQSGGCIVVRDLS